MVGRSIDPKWEAYFILHHLPSEKGELLTCPTVILGSGGTITLWYLLNSLSCSTKAIILEALLPLWEQLKCSILGHSWQTWHEDDRLVSCLEFALTSHMQGHLMSSITHTCLFDPMISIDLNMSTAFQWVSDMTILNSILSVVLSIMHLQIYDVGIQGTQRMKEWAVDNHPHMHSAFSIWPTIFTNISLICSWYDILASVSDYKDCIDLIYSSGTVAAFLGHLQWLKKLSACLHVLH
ncbi:hypothetical protein V8B97DRAFT_2022768 [Scleroderma yunnanense]